MLRCLAEVEDDSRDTTTEDTEVEDDFDGDEDLLGCVVRAGVVRHG